MAAPSRWPVARPRNTRRVPHADGAAGGGTGAPVEGRGSEADRHDGRKCKESLFLLSPCGLPASALEEAGSPHGEVLIVAEAC